MRKIINLAFLFLFISLSITMVSCDEEMEKIEKRNGIVREYVEHHELWSKTDSVSSNVSYYIHFIGKHKYVIYKYDQKYRGNIVPIHVSEQCPECLKTSKITNSDSKK